MKYILYFLLFNTGCAEPLKYDPEFVPYINKFERIFKIKPAIPISFSDKMDERYIGECFYVFHRIKISRKYWATHSPVDREELLFHELGHCVLYLKHDDRVDVYGRPLSIMNSTHISGQVYVYYYDDYINDMKRKAGL